MNIYINKFGQTYVVCSKNIRKFTRRRMDSSDFKLEQNKHLLKRVSRGGYKRATKKRVTKKRETKKRETKKRGTNKRRNK